MGDKYKKEPNPYFSNFHKISPNKTVNILFVLIFAIYFNIILYFDIISLKVDILSIYYNIIIFLNFYIPKNTFILEKNRLEYL